jgi:hypothetical protein
VTESQVDLCTACGEALGARPIELEALWPTLPGRPTPYVAEEQRLCSTGCARLILEQWGGYLDDLDRGRVAQ